MTQNPERRLYRLIVDGQAPVPAISSYRAVRLALAAIARGALSVEIESRVPYDPIGGAPLDSPLHDWQHDTVSMELLEDEMMHQATSDQNTATLPVTLQQFGSVARIIQAKMLAERRDTLTWYETKILIQMINRLTYLLENEEETD